MWANRRNRNAFKPGDIGNDTTEDISNTQSRRRIQTARILHNPGWGNKGNFSAKHKQRAVCLQMYPKEAFTQNHLGITIPTGSESLLIRLMNLNSNRLPKSFFWATFWKLFPKSTKLTISFDPLSSTCHPARRLRSYLRFTHHEPMALWMQDHRTRCVRGSCRKWLWKSTFW